MRAIRQCAPRTDLRDAHVYTCLSAHSQYPVRSLRILDSAEAELKAWRHVESVGKKLGCEGRCGNMMSLN